MKESKTSIDTAKFILRQARTEDAAELCEVCKNSFYDTFVGTCTEDDMSTYLEKTFPVSRIETEIAATNSWMFVLLLEEKICGYAKLGKQQMPELKHRNAFELERLYLLKSFIDKGLGDILMQKCLQTAKEQGAETIYLGVWEHNYRAQKFYKKYGFEVFGSHPFPIESTPQTDLWMKKDLIFINTLFN
jgi:diamine N-acetyltransferase